MSCDIANGRLEACKDSVSGLDAIYIINYGDYNPDPAALGGDVTYSATAGLEDVITEIASVSTVYKFELKGANSFEQTIQTSRDNGTTFFEQALTIQLKRQDAATHKTIKLLAYGRPHIIVRTRGNQFFIAGLQRGCDVTAGTVSSGSAMGDFSGYNLTFTGMENVPANFLNCSAEDTLLTTVLDGASVVTS
jgi:hypothetical protein